ncbi:MAG TPA: hypothetical protein VFM97_00570 [Gammaproteobacteria bacterium]|nr:hypothetical protein [Gammaproteobacteria bacterium]
MTDIWKAIPHRLITAIDRAIAWSRGEWTYVSDLVTDGRLAQTGWFNRDSTADYYDADGVLQTAAADVPRIAYDPDTHALLGLAMEQANADHAAETATIQPVDDWWNGTAFTVVIRGVAAAYSGDYDYEYFFAGHDGTANNIVALRRQVFNGDMYVLLVRDGVQTFAYNIGHVEPSAEFIALLTGGPEGTAAYVDDNPVYKGDADSGKHLPIVNTIDIGHFQGASQANGYIRSLSMYPVSHVSALPGRAVEPPPTAGGGGETILTPDDGALVAMEDMPVAVRPVSASYVQTSVNWDEGQTVAVRPVSGSYLGPAYPSSAVIFTDGAESLNGWTTTGGRTLQLSSAEIHGGANSIHIDGLPNAPAGSNPDGAFKDLGTIINSFQRIDVSAWTYTPSQGSTSGYTRPYVALVDANGNGYELDVDVQGMLLGIGDRVAGQHDGFYWSGGTSGQYWDTWVRIQMALLNGSELRIAAWAFDSAGSQICMLPPSPVGSNLNVFAFSRVGLLTFLEPGSYFDDIEVAVQ